MKLIIFFFLLTIFSEFSDAQSKKANKFCQLVVDTKGLNINRNKSILIIKRDPEGDTIIHGNLLKKQSSFLIHTAEPFFAHVEIILDNNLFQMSSGFIITNETIRITFDTLDKEPKISGGENEFYHRHIFLLFVLPSYITNNPNFKASLLKNTYDPKFSDMRLQLYYREFEENTIDIVSENKSYYYVLLKLLDRKENFSLKTLEKCYSLFSDTLKNTSKGKELKRYIQQSKKLFIGEAAPPFNVLNDKDVKVNSSSIYSKSKLTLIDFWASWCVPCRKSIKEIKKNYSDIDTLKFQIVSISIDRNKNSWLKAVGEENILWGSYYDPSGSDGKTGKTFNLDYIPQNRIIDTTGKMIAFDLSPEELMKFLKEHSLLLR